MKRTFLLCELILFTLALSAIANAAVEYDYEEGSGYESLVSELTSRRARLSNEDGDPFQNVRFHLGAGLTNTVFTLNLPNGKSAFVAQRGVEANLGIDLLSRSWIAEGTIASYQERDFENSKVGAKDFSLKIAWINRIERDLHFRVAGGLNARYMDASYVMPVTKITPLGSFTEENWRQEHYTTPASIVSLGLAKHLTDGFSVGADVAARSSLTGETPDQSSLDFSVRVDGHF